MRGNCFITILLLIFTLSVICKKATQPIKGEKISKSTLGPQTAKSKKAAIIDDQ